MSEKWMTEPCGDDEYGPDVTLGEIERHWQGISGAFKRERDEARTALSRVIQERDKAKADAALSAASAARDGERPVRRFGAIGVSANLQSKRSLILHFDHEATDVDRANIVDAINLFQHTPAPAPARETPHLGWLYFNEDAGTEWSESHPVESGEVPDATDIRPATLDALKAELLSTWKDAAEDNAALIAAHAARAPAALPMEVSEAPLWQQIEEIERRLMTQIGHPNSMSHKLAFDQFANELRQVFRAIDGRARDPEWQPIATAPKDGTRILCTGGGCDGVQIAEYMTTIGAWGTETAILDDCDDEPDGYGRPTHWQHLPAASVEFCPICGGDCSAANPPVMNCPNNLPSAPAGGKDR